MSENWWCPCCKCEVEPTNVTFDERHDPERGGCGGMVDSSQPANETGIELISKERVRQVSQEGWTSSHDDEHDDGELARAACAYIQNYNSNPTDARRWGPPPLSWPWDDKWWKPKGPIQDLIRAGALIAGEIDRLQRVNVKKAERSHRESFAALQARVAELEGWKAQALTVLNGISLQEIGKELGLCLGTNIGPEILPAVRRLKARVAELEAALEQTTRNLDAQAERHLEAVQLVGGQVERIEELEGALRGLLAEIDNLYGAAAEFLGPNEDNQPCCQCCHMELTTPDLKGHRSDCLSDAIMHINDKGPRAVLEKAQVGR